MIKGVLFDLDGTLFDRDAAIRELLETQYSEFEMDLRPIPRQDFTAHVARLDNHGGGDKDDVYASVARDFGLTTDIVPTLVSDFWQRYHDFCRPFLGVLQTLEELRRNGKKVAVVTNGRKSVQEGTIAALHLSHLLDAVLISEVEGVKKPDRRIFERAVERLGFAPSECCHIGDHPVADVVGRWWLAYEPSGRESHTGPRQSNVCRALTISPKFSFICGRARVPHRDCIGLRPAR